MAQPGGPAGGPAVAGEFRLHKKALMPHFFRLATGRVSSPPTPTKHTRMARCTSAIRHAPAAGAPCFPTRPEVPSRIARMGPGVPFGGRPLAHPQKWSYLLDSSKIFHPSTDCLSSKGTDRTLYGLRMHGSRLSATSDMRLMCELSKPKICSLPSIHLSGFRFIVRLTGMLSLN